MERAAWNKCEANTWCPFWEINLNHKYFDELEGIYIIWHESVTVMVGQGSIRERLRAHMHEKEFEDYKSKYLLVTWCTISSCVRDGVVKFLFNQYHPLLGGLCPDVMPIPVNLPFAVHDVYSYGSIGESIKNNQQH